MNKGVSMVNLRTGISSRGISYFSSFYRSSTNSTNSWSGYNSSSKFRGVYGGYSGRSGGSGGSISTNKHYDTNILVGGLNINLSVNP